MAIKTTPQTEQASINVVKATQLINTAVSQLTSLSDTVENLEQQIEEKQQSIKALDAEYSEKLRASQVDLAIKVKEDNKLVVDTYANTNNLVLVEKDKYEELTTNLSNIKAIADTDKNVALKALDSTLRKEFVSTVEVLKSQQDARLAEATARNQSLTEKTLFLQDQVNNLLTQLSEQRQAEIEKVKAANPQPTNITNITDNNKK